jgi:hypothetical protein
VSIVETKCVPEAALPLCTAAADVYSLCVLSYQILSKGSLPFPDVESIRKLKKLKTKRMYAFQAFWVYIHST